MNIKLKEIKAKDILWFHKINTMNEIKKWINNAPASWSMDETLEWFYEYSRKRISEKNNLEYIMIASNENNEKIGYIQIYNHDILNNKAEIGIMIDKKFQGKGIARESLKCAIEFSFKELKINKLYSKIRKDNCKSLKFFKLMNFTEDGLLKDEIYDGNKYWDFVLLSKIIKSRRDKE